MFGAGLELAAAALSGRRQLLILTYHRVLREPDPLLPQAVDAARFEQHVRILKERFRPMALSEAVARLYSGSLAPRSVCITMDDGYANNHDVALPILRKHGVPATCFVATGFIGGAPMWNDAVIEAIRRTALTTLDLRGMSLGSHEFGSPEARRRAVDTLLEALKYLPQNERAARAREVVAAAGVGAQTDLMMSEEQIRALHAGGVEIGAHTVSHPILARTEESAAREEIVESRQRLQEILRAPVRSFAYPNGQPGRDYARVHVDLVRAAGFETAVSTAWGPARSSGDRWQMPRLAPWDRNIRAFGLRLVRAYTQREVALA